MNQNNYEINHIGYLTENIDNAISSFSLLGYTASEVTNDDNQKTKICFLKKENETMLELVEPYQDNMTMLKMLKRLKGTSPYHICYEVNDIMSAFTDLSNKGWLPIFQPVAAPAFDNRLICYFYSREIGFIELLNKK